MTAVISQTGHDCIRKLLRLSAVVQHCLTPILHGADTSRVTVISSQVGLLSRLIDASALRHQVISQNVANVNTPGYHRLDVSFEHELAKALEGPAEINASAVIPVVQPEAGLPERADGNNVDIDREMGQLNKNALLYQTYIQVLAGNLSTMRSAITGR